jgi:hypothetical protein
MNRFADAMEGLRKRTAGEKIMKTLEKLDALEILGDFPEESARKHRLRLPYSSEPRLFEEPWR